MPKGLNEIETEFPKTLNMPHNIVSMCKDYMDSTFDLLEEEIEIHYENMDIKVSISLVREFLNKVDPGECFLISSFFLFVSGQKVQFKLQTFVISRKALFGI